LRHTLDMEKTRLDTSLVARGLVQSRARARDLILRGLVTVDGVTETKQAAMVGADARLQVESGAAGYVSRGAEKLIAALDHFGFDAEGRVALDVGVSTGGFSEVLLERGAAKVYAVDVGQNQLNARLREDARIVVLEKQDARQLTRTLVPEPVQALVVDVSFISLTKALPAALVLTAPGAWLAALVKPQFEAGPEAIGKGGIVRDEAVRDAAVKAVGDWMAAQPGWRVMGVIPSPILGGSGNAEFLLGAVRDA
jgi:23S rRNA (cytidine1920-2'-O)/16S rRNA (cytidine1409-2'-O)-methyltransferase